MVVIVLKNKEYWQERFLLLEESSNKIGNDTKLVIENAFTRAIRQLEREIESWTLRFAKNNKITMAEARRWLNNKELAELKWSIEQYIKYGQENAINQKWEKQLENASAKFHISRLESLKIHTQQIIEELYGNYVDEVDKMARKVYMEDYYRTVHEVQKGLEIGFNVGVIDECKLKAVIDTSWGADNLKFSDRIWRNKEKLLNELQNELVQNIITGQPPKIAIDRIAKKMNTSKSNAGRLVMTEQAYYHAKAQKTAYQDLDVECVEIVATLDNRTSKICQEMDGKIVEMKDYLEGVTVPPFHPNCRSVTVPYFEDNNTPRWARNDDGSTEIVENMTYPEWRKEYVGKKDNSFEKTRRSDIIKTDKQLGKKIGKHTKEYGLDPSKAEDREKLLQIIDDIINNPDEYLDNGMWRGQGKELPSGLHEDGPVDFYIKGEDVVVVNKNNEFVTILKGGVGNARVKDARGR